MTEKDAAQRAEMRKAFEDAKDAFAILKKLAEAEENQGYGSVGAALGKMTRKAQALMQDCYVMQSRGFASGAMRIGG